MSDYEYEDLLAELTEDELLTLCAYEQDKKTIESNEPLTKDNYGNNLAQVEYTDAIGEFKYVLIIGGNKIGKTHIMAKIAVACCKGKAAEYGIDFKTKPPLNVWYGGRTLKVLGDEPLKSLKRFLKGEGIDHRTIYSGQEVSEMRIWDDYGNESTIYFKPYIVKQEGVGTWESGNVDLVLADEEMPRKIFSAIKPKVSFTAGKVLMTMTPDHGITWSYDFLQGNDPDHSVLLKNERMKVIQATTFDNLLNFKIAKQLEWVRFPTNHAKRREHHRYLTGIELAGLIKRENLELKHFPKKKVGEQEVYDILPDAVYVETPDTFAEHLSQFSYMSQDYQMRILGLFVSVAGKVYDFQKYKHNEDGTATNFNVFDLEELPDYKDLKFFATLDYGYSDEFVCLLIAIDKFDTKWVLQEIYQSYLTSDDQAKAMMKMFASWQVMPEMIIADKQINDEGRIQDKQKPHISSIKDSYQDTMNFYNWRTEEMDKRDPETKRDRIRKEMKEGKIRFNAYNNWTYYTQQELMKLEYADTREKVKGKDHADAALRYFYGANISYEFFLTTDELNQRKNISSRMRSVY